MAEFVVALVERSKDAMSWLIATRSTVGLPIGTWLAYGDTDLAIDERDPALYTRRGADDRSRISFGDSERGVVRAVGVDGRLADRALFCAAHVDAFGRSSQRRGNDARDDLSVLRRAGVRWVRRRGARAVGRGHRIAVDRHRRPDGRRLRSSARDRRTSARTDGVHLCGVCAKLSLPRPVPRIHSARNRALGASPVRRGTRPRRARARVDRGSRTRPRRLRDCRRAVATHCGSSKHMDSDLLERARGDLVARAVDALDEPARRENARILAIRGMLQATAGKNARAEALFTRAIARAGDDRELVAIASLRLAILLANLGRDPEALLEALVADETQSQNHRAEALSLLTAQRATAGDAERAAAGIPKIEALLVHVDSDQTRAKVLQRLGAALYLTGDIERARATLLEAAELANELHLYSLASRACAALANIAVHEEDDIAKQLWYSQQWAIAKRDESWRCVRPADISAADAEYCRGASSWMWHGFRKLKRNWLAWARPTPRSGNYIPDHEPRDPRRVGGTVRGSSSERLILVPGTVLHFDIDRISL